MTPEELEKLMKVITELRIKPSFEIGKIEIRQRANEPLHLQRMEEIALLQSRGRKLIEQLREVNLKAEQEMDEFRKLQKQTDSQFPNIDNRLKALLNVTKIQNSNSNDKH